MSAARRIVAGAVVALGLILGRSVIPVLAAGSWWVTAPPSSPPISAVASDAASITLAISRGIAGWYSPASGSFTPTRSASGTVSGVGPVVAVGADGNLGVVAHRLGQLVQVSKGGRSHPLPGVSGVPRSVALAGVGDRYLAVATARGLFSGRLGSRLNLVASGSGTAVIAPPTTGLPWLALVGGRLWERHFGRGWAPVTGAPNFGQQTRALAELASGVVLVGEAGGLIWRGEGASWSRALQILPYGGLGGVPTVTSLVADGSTSAYVGTAGFGTMLTPDGGYTWYRAAPPSGVVSGLATVGPVFSTKAHGYVVALTPAQIYLHRLQPLPEPLTYPPSAETAELVGTAAVTLATAFLVVLFLWLPSRRHRRRSVSSE